MCLRTLICIYHVKSTVNVVITLLLKLIEFHNMSECVFLFLF